MSTVPLLTAHSLFYVHLMQANRSAQRSGEPHGFVEPIENSLAADPTDLTYDILLNMQESKPTVDTNVIAGPAVTHQ